VTTHRPLLLVTIVLLLVSAFGGLSVGIPLVVTEVTGPLTPRASDLLVPFGVATYGLLSLVGALALLAGWRRSLPLVLVPQGLVALGLLWIDLTVVADPSLLVVAAIAGGAAASVLADRGLGRRS
jgi:hypothetical protein